SKPKDISKNSKQNQNLSNANHISAASKPEYILCNDISVHIGAGVNGLMSAILGALNVPNRPHLVPDKRALGDISSRHQIIAVTVDSMEIIEKAIRLCGLDKRELLDDKIQKLDLRFSDDRQHLTTLCMHANDKQFSNVLSQHAYFIEIGELQDVLLALCNKLQNISILANTSFHLDDIHSRKLTLKNSSNGKTLKIIPAFINLATGKPKDTHDPLNAGMQTSYNPYNPSSKLRDMNLLVMQLKAKDSSKYANIDGKPCFITEANEHKFGLQGTKERLFLAGLNVPSKDEKGNRFTRYQLNIQLPTYEGNSLTKEEDTQAIVLASINEYFGSSFRSLSDVEQDFDALPLFRGKAKENNELKQKFGNVLKYAIPISAQNHIMPSPIIADGVVGTGDWFIASTPLGAYGANAAVLHAVAVAKFEEATFDHNKGLISDDEFEEEKEIFEATVGISSMEWLNRSSRTMKEYNTNK
ncbi:MAG: hypothetical protein RLZZ210_1703, partial [Pseudomonadota bacterium]